MTTHPQLPRALAVLAAAGLVLTGCGAVEIGEQSLGDWIDSSAPDSVTDAAAGAGSIDAAATQATLDQLEIAPETEADYDRDRDYGDGWDTLETGCDVRNTVLARDMVEADLAADGCTVESGVLEDLYTGQRIDFTRGSAPGQSDAVPIEHLVPLSEAHKSGAAQWPQDRREAFAQDMSNLLAADGPTNNAKGNRDAGEWLPPNEAFWCSYVAGQVEVKATYDLSMDTAEAERISEILTHC